MKTILQTVCAFSLVLFTSGNFAQTANSSATLGMTMQCTGGSANRAGIAYNPNQEYYYSINAGSSSLPIETFSSTGAPLASIASGFSYRGFWWNPNTSGAEGRIFSPSGINTQDLDASFFPLGTGSQIVAGTSPDTQSCGDYDPVDDEIYYYFSGDIYRYDRATHTLINSYAVTGIPGNIADLNTNCVGYTGVAGAEFGLYDYVAQALYFIDKTTGAYVSTCTLPASAPTPSSFQMSFENGYLWLYNVGTEQWEGYKAVELCSVDLSVTNASPTLISNASGATYQWLNCSNGYGVIAGETNPSYTATGNGSYAVEVTQNSCVDTSACYTVAGIGFEEEGKLITALYPNPTDGKVTVNMSSLYGSLNYSILTIDGRLVSQGTTTVSPFEIDLDEQESGLYIIRFDNGQEVSTHRIIKE